MNVNKKFKVCVVIPCFNVKRKILKVIKKIDLNFVNLILVIDDKCPEKTGDMIEQKNLKQVKVIKHGSNMGVGGATITGFKYAIQNKFDFVVKLDGDGQHEPRYIKHFITELQNKNFNFCKGTRFIDYKERNKIPTIRFLGNYILTFATKINCANRNITDAVNGFMAIKTSLLKIINLNNISQGFFFEEDLLFHCSFVGLTIKEIQIKTIYFGKSNLIPFKIIIPFIINHTKNFIRRYLINWKS